MHNGDEDETGSHATGSHETGSPETGSDMSSITPKKQQPTVKYRETTTRDSDSELPASCVTASREFDDPRLPTGFRFAEDGRQAGHGISHRSSLLQGYHDSAPDRRTRTAYGSSCFAANKSPEQNMSVLQANKEMVLALIADILSSGATNEEKERKLGDIISDLETVRRRLVEQKAVKLKVK